MMSFINFTWRKAEIKTLLGALVHIISCAAGVRVAQAVAVLA